MNLNEFLKSQKPVAFSWERLCLQIADESGEKIAKGGELSFLRGKQKAWAAARSDGDYHTSQQAVTDFMEHQKKMIDEVAAGKIKETRHYDVEEFRAQYRQKATTCYEATRLITQEILPLAREISERFAAVAEAFAKDAIKAEIEAHAKFGVPYNRPSALIEAFAQVAGIARGRCVASPYNSASPQQLLPYLKLD